MPKPFEIHDGVYLVGSSTLTDPEDCCVYLVDIGDLVLIDAGAGGSVPKILENVAILGKNYQDITAVIATHCHFDHAGGISGLKEKTGCQVIAHERDAAAIQTGDPVKTAAGLYNAVFPPARVDYQLQEKREVLKFKKGELLCLHTPGHTPGSIAVILDQGGQRVLFGQDIHGPFSEEFGSDLAAWRKSMRVLLGLKADILCEGHFGIYRPEAEVRRYIENYLKAHSEDR